LNDLESSARNSGLHPLCEACEVRSSTEYSARDESETAKAHGLTKLCRSFQIGTSLQPMHSAGLQRR
jgi:hypothetical protein